MTAGVAPIARHDTPQGDGGDSERKARVLPDNARLALVVVALAVAFAAGFTPFGSRFIGPYVEIAILGGTFVLIGACTVAAATLVRDGGIPGAPARPGRPVPSLGRLLTRGFLMPSRFPYTFYDADTLLARRATGTVTLTRVLSTALTPLPVIAALLAFGVHGLFLSWLIAAPAAGLLTGWAAGPAVPPAPSPRPHPLGRSVAGVVVGMPGEYVPLAAELSTIAFRTLLVGAVLVAVLSGALPDSAIVWLRGHPVLAVLPAVLAGCAASVGGEAAPFAAVLLAPLGPGPCIAFAIAATTCDLRTTRMLEARFGAGVALRSVVVSLVLAYAAGLWVTVALG